MWPASESVDARKDICFAADAATTMSPAGALGIWARQVENARQQTETAVTELSLNFGDIVQKMDASIASSQRESEAHAHQALLDGQQAQMNLSQVIASLKDMQSSRDVLATEIASIVGYISELKSMAEEVKMIAFRTNLLSINAAIEAAHAGEGGKGFAVVAHEVQMLSNESRDTVHKINQRIGAITETLHRIDGQSKSVAGQDALAISTSEQSIRTVLERQNERVTQFASAADSSRAEHNAIRNDIEDALVKLQFQDRVSQILAQVVGAMQQRAASADTAAPDALAEDVERERLQQMASSYTTDEQRRIHEGLEAETVAPREVTFF